MRTAEEWFRIAAGDDIGLAYLRDSSISPDWWRNFISKIQEDAAHQLSDPVAVSETVGENEELLKNTRVFYARDGNVWWISLVALQAELASLRDRVVVE